MSNPLSRIKAISSLFDAAVLLTAEAGADPLQRLHGSCYFNPSLSQVLSQTQALLQNFLAQDQPAHRVGFPIAREVPKSNIHSKIQTP